MSHFDSDHVVGNDFVSPVLRELTRELTKVDMSKELNDAPLGASLSSLGVLSGFLDGSGELILMFAYCIPFHSHSTS